MVGRTGEKHGTAWSTSIETPSPLIAHRQEEPRPDIVLIIALGLDAATLRQAIAQATPASPKAPLPLFWIDQTDFHPLTEHDHLFEHFPSAASQAMVTRELPWNRYIQRRLDLLVLKWRPVSIVPLGRKSQQILSSWRERNARRETTHLS
jgi:hypothetical protein